MKSRSILIFFATLLSMASSDFANTLIPQKAPSLCKSNESLIATCGHLKNEKIMSICAKPDPKEKDFEYIEYRFGKPDNIEMSRRVDEQNKSIRPFYRGVDTNYSVNYSFLESSYYYVISVPEERYGARLSIWITDIRNEELHSILCNPGLDNWDHGEEKTTNSKLFKQVDGNEMFTSTDGLPKMRTDR